MKDAWDIPSSEVEALLRDISLCFPSRDFDAWAARVSLPLRIETADGAVTMTTPAELRANFENYMAAMDQAGIDLVLRTPLQNLPTGTGAEGGVRISYRTELLAQGVAAAAPFVSTAVVHRDAHGTWRIRAIENGLGHHPWTGITPRTERGLQ